MHCLTCGYSICSAIHCSFADILMIIGLFSSDPLKVLGFYFVFFLMDLLASLFAFKLEEENRSMVNFTTLYLSSIMTYVVVKSIFSSIRGIAVGWNKLKRVGSVDILRNIRRHLKSRLSALFFIDFSELSVEVHTSVSIRVLIVRHYVKILL